MNNYSAMNTLADCNVIEFPKIRDHRGNLTFIEGDVHIPFSIARTYWIYDVPGGETRSGHACKGVSEVIISLSGAFDVVLNDGLEEKTVTLNRSYKGMLVPKMIWRQFRNFSTNAVVLVLSSDAYDRGDYIEDFERYREARAGA